MKFYFFLLAALLLPHQGHAQIISPTFSYESQNFAQNIASDFGFQYFGSKKASASSRPAWYTDAGIRRRVGKSALYTILPIIFGSGFVYSALGTKESSVLAVGFLGAGLIVGGLGFGPSMGYFGTGVSHLSNYGFSSGAFRTAILVLTPIVAIPIAENSGSLGAALSIVVGSVLAVGVVTIVSVFGTIGSLPSRFRNAAKEQGLASLRVQPAAFYAANNTIAPGINFSLKF